MALYYRKDFFEKHDQKYDYIDSEDFKFLLKNIPLSKISGNVLDLACGSGSFGEKFQQTFSDVQVVGTDICLPLLKWAEYPVCQSDVLHLPFQENSLDCIIAAAAFHHFENIEKVIKECGRCLKQNGIFIAYDPNKYHPQRFIMMTDPLRHIFYKNGDHAISPQYFKKTLEKSGFKEVTTNYFSLKGKKTSKGLILNYKIIDFAKRMHLFSLIPLFSPWFIITGKKI